MCVFAGACICRNMEMCLHKYSLSKHYMYGAYYIIGLDDIYYVCPLTWSGLCIMINNKIEKKFLALF